jgi:hypothetical protein
LFEPLKNFGPLPTRRRTKRRSHGASHGPPAEANETPDTANVTGGDGGPSDATVNETTGADVETPVAVSDARRAEVTITDTTTDTGPLPSPSDFAKGPTTAFGFTGVWRIDKYVVVCACVCDWMAQELSW